MGQDVDHRAARLAKHEAPDSPVLVAKRVRDLDALLHSHGVDGIDIGDLNRDTGPGHIVVTDDGHLRRGLLGEATVTTQPMSITTSKPSRSTKKSRVSAGRSDLMFGTVLLIAIAQLYADPMSALLRQDPDGRR